jgi:hypothetical protein
MGTTVGPTAQPTQGKCATCRYYDPTLNFDASGTIPVSNTGLCRIGPPRVTSSGATVWPTVNKIEWCGDYQP